MKFRHVIVFFVLSLGLNGCVNLKQPDTPKLLPLASEQWLEAPAEELLDFKELSLSATLNGLIKEALANNYNLQAAAVRLDSVRLQAQAAKGDRYPSINGSISSQTQKIGGIETDSASAIASLNWELDVWARVASQSHVVWHSYLEQQTVFKAARYSLAAQVSKLWFDVILAKQQLVLTQRRITSLKNSNDIISDGFESGIRSALDVYSAKAEIASHSAELAEKQRILASRLNALAVLLGRSPQAIDIPEQLPRFNALIPSPLSASLIERRTDVKAATHRIAAQHAQTKLAFANRLPRFSLTATSGAISPNLSDVLSGNQSTWSLLGGLTVPLFQGGKLAREQARQQQLLAASILDYQHIALTAFAEVETHLSNEFWYIAQVSADEEAVTISQQAEAQALEQYISGISNVNTWLQAQRTAFQRQENLLKNQNALLANRVDLYLALGGDFNGDDL